MTIEIPKNRWTEFFNDLSKRRFGWTAKIEILDEDTGDQILSDGLPLSGIAFEEKSNRPEIELMVGETPGQHLSHKIRNPLKVEYLDKGEPHDGVLLIEDENKTRTLVSLLDPMPVFVGYEGFEIVAASPK